MLRGGRCRRYGGCCLPPPPPMLLLPPTLAAGRGAGGGAPRLLLAWLACSPTLTPTLACCQACCRPSAQLTPAPASTALQVFTFARWQQHRSPRRFLRHMLGRLAPQERSRRTCHDAAIEAAAAHAFDLPGLVGGSSFTHAHATPRHAMPCTVLGVLASCCAQSPLLPLLLHRLLLGARSTLLLAMLLVPLTARSLLLLSAGARAAQPAALCPYHLRACGILPCSSRSGSGSHFLSLSGDRQQCECRPRHSAGGRTAGAWQAPSRPAEKGVSC